MRGVGRLKRWLRNATAPFRSGVVILLYHRAFEASSDPQRLCVHPDRFTEHLEILRKNCTVLSLKGLCHALEKRQLPKRGVLIAFDDGYVDNLWNAKPLLERYEVPATVFVTTGYIGKEKEFWWDELESLVLLAPSLPKVLQVELNGTVYQWGLDRWQVIREPDSICKNWHVGMKEDPTPRHQAYRELHRLVRPLSHEEREKALTMLRAQAKNGGQPRPMYRALTPEEVCKLAEGGLVEVGAHTVTHPVLSGLPVDVQKREIAESRQTLETLLGQEIVAFAYPYGGRSDVGEMAVRLAQETGFRLAFANVPGIALLRSDPFWLPRFLVRDWEGETFERRLRAFFTV